jgi:putative inorganic carbon (HCO3(-)) transporter
MLLFYILILVMPLSDHHIWSQFLGDLTGIKYLGLACLLYAIYHLAVRKSLPLFLGTRQAQLFLVLFFLGTLSYFTKPSQLPWYHAHWITYLSLIMLFFITLVVVDSPERLRWTLLTATASLALASLYSLRDWQLNHLIYPGYRPSGVVGDANYFSVDILLFLPVTLMLAQRSRARWQRWFCLGCFAITFFALLLSSSRGAFLGLLVASLYLVLRSRNRIRNLAVITLALTIVVMFSPNSPIERLRKPSGGDEASIDTHFALLRGGVRMILTNPVLGVGLDNFMSRIPDYVSRGEASRMDRVARVAHNSYVEVGAEAGVPALLVFLGVLACSFISLEKVALTSLRCGAAFLGEAALGLQTGLIGGSVAIFFISGEYEKMLWMSIFICMCLPPLAAEAKRKRRQLERQADASLVKSASDSDGLLETART